ncbi:polysaccharide ABC transporter ATP-binding protein [Polaribacter sp. 11A2H]|uniref:ABC transporter ATP-binding protein n=1 Tax=Polaribacter sp. 11A2H TaxID=2687290 RepID=UPI00140B4256|nr:ABC transporter ATP-binding protein [Polaribacter sp. 11A2H]
MKSNEVILKVENLSKQYRLGTVGTGTISHDLNRWWHKVRGKEDPFLKVGESNNRAIKGESEYVWALKDINFEVKRGEVLGIIGKNGAGKSTLLKILSKVTGPSTGSIKANGRIASLLEVGTGFHPEMTGKENVFLNGAILGMTKKEIADKLDEIIQFSGCERYIDTPVKRYSSGMKVRLAFAVAAFLEPDILVVDEVLAVGDAEFQKKAIGKMQDISSQGGRTVLFVSHNMNSVAKLCTSTILLENGEIVFTGEVEEGIKRYEFGNLKDTNNSKDIKTRGLKVFSDILSVKILKTNDLIYMGDDLSFSIKLKIKNSTKNVELGYRLYHKNTPTMTNITNWDIGALDLDKGNYNFNAAIPKNTLFPGIYTLEVFVRQINNPVDVIADNAKSFKVEWKDITGHEPNFDTISVKGMYTKTEWNIEKDNG